MSELYGTLTRTDDDYAVTFEREYATTCDDLWAAVTEPERLVRWLAAVDGDLREGGHAVVHFDDGDSRFAIDTCAAPERLTVRWQHRSGDTVVRVSLFPLGDDRSRLVLVHEGLSKRLVPDYAGGWHWHLDTLDGILAGRSADRTHWDALAARYTGLREDVTTATY